MRRRRLAPLRLPRLALRRRPARASSCRRCAATTRALRERARIRAYRGRRSWADSCSPISGPEPAPLLPRYDLFVWEGVLRDIGRALVPCNWLQIMENSVDPVHLEWLHGHHLGAVRGAAGLPAPTPLRAPARGDRLRRLPPRHRQAARARRREPRRRRLARRPPARVPDHGARRRAAASIASRSACPVDDTHTLHFWYSCYLPRDGAPAPRPGREIPVYEVPFRDERGAFLLDFVDGGDIMTWVTQGADRRPHARDAGRHRRGIALLRRLSFEQIERVRAGEDPLGIVRVARGERPHRAAAGARQVRRGRCLSRRIDRDEPRPLQPASRADPRRCSASPRTG